MRYSFTTVFLLAALVFPAWCDSREETYDPDNHEAYSPQKQSPDRKNYYYQQNEAAHYAMPPDHSQPTSYPPINHQYRSQAPRQLQDEAALESHALTLKGSGEEIVEENKCESNMVYQQMKPGANNFAYYQRPNMMMNAPRPVSQFSPQHKFTMEQQMQMQMQLQRRQLMQQQMAAAQSQAFMNQQAQQNFAPPPPQQYVQPPAQQHFAQHYQPTPTPSQASPQMEGYLASRAAAAPALKTHYNTPVPTPKAHYSPPQTTPQPWTQAQPQQGYYEEYEHNRHKE